MNALALSLTPSISSNETYLVKGFFVKWARGQWGEGEGRGRGGVLKEQMKTNSGRAGVKPISTLTL